MATTSGDRRPDVARSPEQLAAAAEERDAVRQPRLGQAHTAEGPLDHLGFAVPWSALEMPREQFEIAFAHGGLLVRAILALTRRRFEREHRVAFRYLPSAEQV